jgi:hypothetical protein
MGAVRVEQGLDLRVLQNSIIHHNVIEISIEIGCITKCSLAEKCVATSASKNKPRNES